jgi:hypothetical protein
MSVFDFGFAVHTVARGTFPHMKSDLAPILRFGRLD